MLWKNLELKKLYQNCDLTDFKPFEEYFTFLLTCSGYNVLHNETFASKRCRFTIGVVFSSTIIGFLSSLLVIWKYANDLEAIIMGSITMIMCVQMLSKLSELYLHRKDHSEMISIVLQQTKDLETDRRLHKIGAVNYRRAQFYISISSVSYLSALASLAIYPFIPLYFQGEFKLAVNVELPGTNHKEAIGFTINYIYSTMLATVCCLMILAYDVLIYMYVFHISGRFQILEEELTQLGDFSSAYNTQAKQHKLIIKCAMLHSETLQFVRRCSQLFSTVYCFVWISDFVVICISFFHMQLVVFASSGLMFIAGIVQSFMFSNCGQIVCNASESCSRAIYNSYWYALTRIDQRKIVLFMLTQSQGGYAGNIGFTAGGFPVSLALFMNVSLKIVKVFAQRYCLDGFIKNYFI